MNDGLFPGASAAADDGELIRYLDGELDALARARLERVLAADPAVARRLETLRRRGERMNRLLAASDAPAASDWRSGQGGGLDQERALGYGRALEHGHALGHGRALEHDGHALGHGRAARPGGAPRARRPRLMRAAIVVLALAGAALLAPPARAFIAGRIQDLLATIWPGGRPVSDTPARPAGSPPEETFLTRFSVTGEEFRVETASPQAAGSLTLRADRSGGDTGSAAILGSAEQADLLVADGTLRIRNARTASASYTVTLPPSVRWVHVRIGDGPVTTIPLGTAAEHTIDLTSR